MTSWKFKVRLMLQKLPMWISQSRPLTSWLDTEKGAAPAEWAVAGFEALGPIAKPAIPELTRRINLPHSIGRKALAMHALSYIGPEVHPVMLAVLTNINPMELRWASPCIGRMGPDARPLIPLLVQNLQHTNLSVACSCTRALGELKLEPGFVVPALMMGLADPRQQMQIQAATSLKQFGKLALPALHALSNSLNRQSSTLL